MSLRRPRTRAERTTVVSLTAATSMVVLAAVCLTLPLNPWIYWPVATVTFLLAYYAVGQALSRAVTGQGPDDVVTRSLVAVLRRARRHSNAPTDPLQRTSNDLPNDRPTSGGR